ncbi:type IV pilus assembly protein PilA [Pullulanibacillus pueri]|uniref:Prepilin-type N-terminal cleavage/methylation domain-containing protein n=1 Tax=Pullulanibacillus pueri TaxID=1437324 RepID=A0A8J3EMX0_9BACL|nr:prepilin-type N-terminal cleavage/methylation domain-containing protein [Pullulanibacillus pueri]MBM7680507.1 type IV pilus assembly protein PilA [Pullulanibacillus pueri]GGH86061.1 hypothetical protein GCM10007096_32890 [Pullulanibacillus pueri]
MRKLLKSQKGFTLVELLAVIVILAIIAAIAVPSVGHLISKSKDNAKVAEAIEIISASKTYVAAENDQLSFNDNTASITEEQLAPYIDNLKDNSWTITVTKDANTESYSYSINDHDDPVSDAHSNSASEQQLLDYNTGND